MSKEAPQWVRLGIAFAITMFCVCLEGRPSPNITLVDTVTLLFVIQIFLKPMGE